MPATCVTMQRAMVAYDVLLQAEFPGMPEIITKIGGKKFK